MPVLLPNRVTSVLAAPAGPIPEAAVPLLQSSVSVVVPTRNEAANVGELVPRLARAMPSVPMDIIFVDDSDDDTPEAIARLRPQCHHNLVVVHRPANQRSGGLAGAVVHGLWLAKTPWVVVMDADLQHPPEVIPALLAEANRSTAGLVVASRYGAEGNAGGFGPVRSLLSRGSTMAARAVFPRRLRAVSDPLSGFFLVRRDALDLGVFRPCGFKILLEIIVRAPGLRQAEVAYHFSERFAGGSKASLREGLRYLQLLLALRFGDGAQRFTRFGAVGLSGLLVNLLVLAVATDAFGLFYLVSAAVAAEVSTAWNFGLTEFWVFCGRGQRGDRLGRALAFFAVSNAALALTAPAMFVLTSVVGLHYLLSSLIVIAGLMVLRYAVADRFKTATTVSQEALRTR